MTSRGKTSIPRAASAHSNVQFMKTNNSYVNKIPFIFTCTPHQLTYPKDLYTPRDIFYLTVLHSSEIRERGQTEVRIIMILMYVKAMQACHRLLNMRKEPEK